MQQVIKNSVDQYTVLTVLPGETDQTSKMPVPQWCHFMESHADAPASCSTGSAGLSTAEGSSWLILMKTSFILMNCPFIIWEKPCLLKAMSSKLACLITNVMTITCTRRSHVTASSHSSVLVGRDAWLHCNSAKIKLLLAGMLYQYVFDIMGPWGVAGIN